MRIQSKKKSLQSKENEIKKSNEISMAELNQNLSLNQMQLLAYAIFSTQQDGKTEFQKMDFEKKFAIEQLRPNDAMDDAYRLLDLKVELRDLENEKSRGHNVFMDYYYDKGQFIFNWHPDIVPHILDLKERYVAVDLEVASNFKSGFSWRLYEYLKAHYGFFRKVLTKEDILCLFSVQEKKAYQRISNFKNRVLNVAIKEINQYTELEVWYKEQKQGRSIVGFEIYWNSGKVVQKATIKQMKLIQDIVATVNDNLFTYVNLDDADNRERAFELIERITSYDDYMTNPVNITAEKADDIVQDIKFHLNVLNGIVGKDKPKRDTSFYYNWLEEE